MDDKPAVEYEYEQDLQRLLISLEEPNMLAAIVGMECLLTEAIQTVQARIDQLHPPAIYRTPDYRHRQLIKPSKERSGR